MTNTGLPLQSGWHLASARVRLSLLGFGLDLLVARAPTAPACLTSRYTTQIHSPTMPNWMRRNSWMVWVCRRLVYCSSAFPATQRPGLEDRKKEDDAGECMTGETESDGGGEESKCQDNDAVEAEGGGSSEKS
jgi:hypothetical protein